jgi:hypothetical protein
MYEFIHKLIQFDAAIPQNKSNNIIDVKIIIDVSTENAVPDEIHSADHAKLEALMIAL